MTGEPLTWGEWWANIAMSGVVGGVVGGLATGLAVAATLWWQRRQDHDARLMQAVQACRAASWAAYFELTLDAPPVWQRTVLEASSRAWVVVALARVAPELRSDVQCSLDYVMGVSGRNLTAAEEADCAQKAVLEITDTMQNWLHDPRGYRKLDRVTPATIDANASFAKVTAAPPSVGGHSG